MLRKMTFMVEKRTEFSCGLWWIFFLQLVKLNKQVRVWKVSLRYLFSRSACSWRNTCIWIMHENRWNERSWDFLQVTDSCNVTPLIYQLSESIDYQCAKLAVQLHKNMNYTWQHVLNPIYNINIWPHRVQYTRQSILKQKPHLHKKNYYCKKKYLLVCLGLLS